jgi:hypothetical protein
MDATNSKKLQMHRGHSVPTVTITDGARFAIEMANCSSAAQVIGMLRIALREYECMVVGTGTMRVVSAVNKQSDHVILESQKRPPAKE